MTARDPVAHAIRGYGRREWEMHVPRTPEQEAAFQYLYDVLQGPIKPSFEQWVPAALLMRHRETCKSCKMTETKRK